VGSKTTKVDLTSGMNEARKHIMYHLGRSQKEGGGGQSRRVDTVGDGHLKKEGGKKDRGDEVTETSRTWSKNEGK